MGTQAWVFMYVLFYYVVLWILQYFAIDNEVTLGKNTGCVHVIGSW